MQLRLIIPLLSCLAGLLWLVSGVEAQTPPDNKVGSDTCLACHDLEPAFFRTAHGDQECEDCHGPGLNHVEAGGDDESMKLASWTAERATQTCLECHSLGDPLGSYRDSHHGRNLATCGDCHQVHPPVAESPLLRIEQLPLCTGCHPGPAADFRRPYRHPVSEGVMDCSDCHNPHWSELNSLKTIGGAQESCVACHADKKGPFIFEHAPSELEGCGSCHLPHGSINAKMLRRAQLFQLCVECHSLAPGLAGDQPPAFHDLRSPRFRECTVCHREIHGSNVSPAFLR